MDDWQLLDEYATRQSETAFRALVDRYSGMVYHAALRQVVNPHAAEEITQAVFVALARKANRIPRRTVLYGWLFRATRFAVLNQVREEATRRRHEQEAIALEAANMRNANDSIWDQISPYLNDALDRLSKPDREIVMIRFFGNKSHREVAHALGVSEDTAKKRVSRAIERLRLIFAERGVVVPAVALAAAFSACGAQAAPAGLASAVAAAASSNVWASSTAATAKGILKLMAWTKTKLAAAVIVGVLLAGGTATVAVIQINAHATYSGPWQVKEITRDETLLARMRPLAQIVPTQFAEDGGINVIRGPRLAGLCQPLSRIIMWAYGYSAQNEYPARVCFEADLPPARYDFIDTDIANSGDALKQEIKDKFGLVGRYITPNTNVFLLKVRNPKAPGLIPPRPNSPRWFRVNRGHISSRQSGGRTLEVLVRVLENDFFRIPIFNEAELDPGLDFDLLWDDSGDPQHPNLDGLKQALLEQLGLELVPAIRPVKMLVVKKANG